MLGFALKNKKVKIIIGAIAIALIAIGLLLSLQKKKELAEMDSFEDCAAAGYPILLSYPEQCNTPDGKHFTRALSEEEKKRLAP